MNRDENVARFEGLMENVKRPGVEGLVNYIRMSDFYTAPASTKFHLSCEGGLLQHSLNVYDALISGLRHDEDTNTFKFIVSGVAIAEFEKETLILVALLHDICKTNFYKIELRNQKVYKPTGTKRDNGGRFDWEQVPVYAVEDKNPYGHGEKSVMMIDEFMKLTMEERYAIRWHMGMSEPQNIYTFNHACEKYPLCFILHSADQEASHFMEDKDDIKEVFREAGADAGQPAAEDADQPAVFEEAGALC